MNEWQSLLSEEERASLKKSSFPDWVAPMLATLSHDHFTHPDWVFERKLDGERCLVFRQGEHVRLFSRNQKSQNAFYPELTHAFGQIEGDVVLDMEVVTFKGNVSSFSALQNRMHVQNPDKALQQAYPVFAYIFDVLYLDGYLVTSLPMVTRKAILKKALNFTDPLRFLFYQNEDGEALLKKACEKGWEGLIAKRRNAPYHHSRSKNWLKFKCARGQEFIVLGYTAPEGERVGFGALLVGYYDEGSLQYAGKVGTGFDDGFLAAFLKKMNQHTRKTCPLASFDDADNAVTWLSPYFVCEVGFTEWTPGGKLRHPRFLGLRKDKSPDDVVRE